MFVRFFEIKGGGNRMRRPGPMGPYRLSPAGEAYDRLMEIRSKLSDDDCREIVLARWGNGIREKFTNFSADEVLHISLIPLVSKKCGKSVSWILTGKEFGTEGGLDYPDHECKVLAGILKNVRDKDLPIIEDLLDYFAPRISDFPSIGPLVAIGVPRYRERVFVFYDRICAIDGFKHFPARINAATAKKYGLSDQRGSDRKNIIYVIDRPTTSLPYGVQPVDEMRFVALAEHLGLPIGLFFDWEETDFYTGRPRCDGIIARYAMVLQDDRSIITEVCSWLANDHAGGC